MWQWLITINICFKFRFRLELECEIFRISPAAYSERSRTSKMELFSKKVNGYKPLTVLPKSSILDVVLGSEYASVLPFWKSIIFTPRICHISMKYYPNIVIHQCINSFITEVPITQKSVHWFSMQSSELVSIW